MDLDPGSARDRPAPALMAAGLGLAPAAWAFHFVATISLVSTACERGSGAWLHATTAVAAPLALVGLWLAVRLRAAVGPEGPNRAVGTSAVALASLSLALIAVEQVVMLALDPCT